MTEEEKEYTESTKRRKMLETLEWVKNFMNQYEKKKGKK